MSPARPPARKKAKSALASTPRRETKPQDEQQDGKEPAGRATATEPTHGNDSARPPLAARIRTRLGHSGTRALLVVVRSGLRFGAVAATYVLGMFAAVTVVPNVFLMVSGGSGVGPASPLEMQVTYWLVPSLFLIGLIFVLVLVVARWLWRAQGGLATKARRSLLGEEAGR
ncbi:hypothetical protein [Nocardiopsis eucommiae]|uniref:hypothetical protein n=1 Tax=Nocardiopsis eucommiae TaxID=2831970 RepID=UPI003D713AC2